MTVNDRYQLQAKSFPDEQERFFPMGAAGSGSYSLTAPPRDLLRLYGEFIYGHRSDQNLITLYHTIPEIYSAVDQIARRVVSATFQLKTVKDDEIIADNKAWNQMLATPNPLQNFKELLYEAVTYKIVTGKNYLYKNIPATMAKRSENIAALWNLPADRIQPVYDYSIKLFSATTITDIIQRYDLFDGVNTAQYDPTLILHTKTLNLDWVDRRLRGKSALLAADIAICNLIAVYEARNVIYTKKGALGAIVGVKEDASGPVPLTPGEKTKIRNATNGEFGLTGRRDTYMISEVPLQYVSFGSTIKDLEPFKESRADMAAIYAVLNVPFDLAPQDDGTTFDNLNNAMKQVYTNNAIPEANSWTQSLTPWLGFDKVGAYIYADFSKINELQENKKEAAQVDSSATITNKTLFLSGVVTLNQWMARQSLPLSKNPLYDILIYDMTPEQLDQVSTITKLQAATAPAPASGNLSLEDPSSTEAASANKP